MVGISEVVWLSWFVFLRGVASVNDLHRMSLEV